MPPCSPSPRQVCDFGLSAQIPRGELDWSDREAVKAYRGLSDKWGTPQYFAPEMLWKAYGPQARTQRAPSPPPSYPDPNSNPSPPPLPPLVPSLRGATLTTGTGTGTGGA